MHKANSLPPASQCAAQCCGCLPQKHGMLGWAASAVRVRQVCTHRTRPAVTHRSISVPNIDPLLEAPLMDLLVNGHDQTVRDPSFLDILQGREAETSAVWMFCRALFCSASSASRARHSPTGWVAGQPGRGGQGIS